MKLAVVRFLAVMVATLSILYAAGIYMGVKEPSVAYVIFDQFLIAYLMLAWAFTGDKA